MQIDFWKITILEDIQSFINLQTFKTYGNLAISALKKYCKISIGTVSLDVLQILSCTVSENE